MLATSKTASCLAVVEPRTESDQRKVRLVPSLLAWAVSPGCSSKPRASDMYSRSAVSSWSCSYVIGKWLGDRPTGALVWRLAACLGVVRVRQELQQPPAALLQVRDDLQRLAVVGEHLQLEVLLGGGLQRVAMKPVRHISLL